MHESELSYIEARAQVRGALIALRMRAIHYMEVTRETMLAYLAHHYPDLFVDIVASLRDITHPNSFDYTLNFEFRYTDADGHPYRCEPVTSEVWSYIHTLDIPLLGTIHDTVPDTRRGEQMGSVQLEAGHPAQETAPA